MIIRELFIKLGLAGANDADRGLGRLNNRVNQSIAAFNILGGVMAGVMGALSVANIARVGDEMQNLRSQIGNSTGDMSGAADQLDALAKHANDGRVSVESYAGSWAKMNSGIKQFGGTAGDTTKFMDTLSAAFVSNGTATESANAALFQLSQTMQGGQVQGEEMNSLIDAQGELYQDIAKAIGGTVNNYKDMQKKGKVTSEMLLNAVNQFYDKYTARVKNMPMTIAQANTIISNRWSLFIDKLNRKTNFISKTADAFLWMADKVEYALNIVTDALGGAENAVKLFAVAIGSAALVASVYAFGAAIQFLFSPVTLIIGALALLFLVIEDIYGWTQGKKSIMGDIFGNFNDYTEDIKKLKTAIDWLLAPLREMAYWLNVLTRMAEPPKWLADLLGIETSVSGNNAGPQQINGGKRVAGAPVIGPNGIPTGENYAPDNASEIPPPPGTVTKRPSWWPRVLGGPGEPLEKNKKTEDGTGLPHPSWMDNLVFPTPGELIPQVSMAPASPATPPKTSVDQKFTYSPQNTFYLQPAGNSGDDFGTSIQQSMSESYQDFVQKIGDDLQYNAGAK